MKKLIALAILLFVMGSGYAMADVIEGKNDDNNGFPAYYHTNDEGQFPIATGTSYITVFTTWETDNVSVAADGTSGTSLNPASESFMFCFQNATAGISFLAVNGTAGNWDGLRVESGGAVCMAGVQYSTISIYNAAASAATMSVSHWR